VSDVRSRDSCRNEYKTLKILPLQSKFIFSLLVFVVNNIDLYHSISQTHDINTRRNFDLYHPHPNLISYQKGAFYFGIKLFNGLPLYIKKLARNTKHFRLALSIFLHSQTVYTLDEYFNQGNQENVEDSCCFVVIIYFIAYILTYLLHGAESFLRS
jgi:hypothetical protein